MSNLWLYLIYYIAPLPAFQGGRYSLSDYQDYLRATIGMVCTDEGYEEEMCMRHKLGDATPTIWYKFTYNGILMYYLARYGETTPKESMNMNELDYTEIWL